MIGFTCQFHSFDLQLRVIFLILIASVIRIYKIFYFRNFELFISELSELIQGFVIFAQTISAEYNDEEAKLSSS